MAQVLPRVLYDNVFRSGGSVAYSGSETSGFEAINAYDWRDFTLFAPADGDSNLEVTLPETTTLTSFAVWIASGSALTSVAAYYEDSPGSFTLLGISSPPGATFPGVVTSPQMLSFTGQSVPAGRKVRVSFLGASSLKVRQVTVGAHLTMQRGQRSGVSPATMTGGLVVSNSIAVNGSIIGRDIRRLDRRGTIDLSHLTEAWVRSDWEPFAIHAQRYPFWYQWDPTNYASEVAFAVADQIEAPRNSGTPGLMQVSMPIRTLV